MTNWTIDKTQASYGAGRLSATWEPARPAAGLFLRTNTGQWPGLCRLRSIGPSQPPTQITDQFCRGNDLVVTYQAVESEQVRLTLQWQVTAPNLAGVEMLLDLTLSVQTALLDSNPVVVVEHEIPGQAEVTIVGVEETDQPVFQESLGAVALAGPAAHLVAEPEGSALAIMTRGRLSGQEMVRSGADSNAPRRLEQRLFEERLEKGVIRRSQIRVAVLTAGSDHEAASRAALKDLLSAPLPLTA